MNKNTKLFLTFFSGVIVEGIGALLPKYWPLEIVMIVATCVVIWYGDSANNEGKE